MLFRQLLLTGSRSELFCDGWRSLREPLSEMLADIWLTESSADELMRALDLDHPDAIRVAERLVLSHPDEAVAFLQRAIMAGSADALKVILRLHSEHWLGLLRSSPS